MAREAFGLDLRVGTVPIADLHAAGLRECLVARHRVSATSIQAMFAGGGLRRAERRCRIPRRLRHRRDAPGAALDCSGLECRWNEIPSPHGETVALLVQALSEDHRRGGAQRIAKPCWRSRIAMAVTNTATRSPGAACAWRTGRQALAGETAVRAHAKARRRSPGCTAIALRAQVALGRMLFATGIRFAGVHWGRYQAEVVANTDRRKFDDTLRVVLAGTADQQRALEPGSPAAPARSAGLRTACRRTAL